MAPQTFTFGEIASKAPSAAGLTGRPRRFPTKKGCGPCACCASNGPAATPVTSAAAVTRIVTRFMGRSLHNSCPMLHVQDGSRDRTECANSIAHHKHRHLHRVRGGLFVESEGRREVPIGVDLCLQIGNRLLRGGNRIGAGEKAARRWVLARNGDQRSRELRRVAGLPAILRSPELELRRSTLIVVVDGWLGVVRRLLREGLRAE